MHAFYRKINSFLHPAKHFCSSPACKKIRRRIAVYSLAALILLGIGLILTHRHQPQSEHQKLESLAGELIAFELADNSLSLHYTIKDPERFGLVSRYGLDPSQISLPVYTTDAYEESVSRYASLVTQMSEINSGRLSERDLWVFQILEDSLNSTMTQLSFPFYGEPLSPSSGEQTSLLVLLAEYRLDSCEDVEHYLKLLACVGDYFDGLLLYEQQKAEAGLFMSDVSLSKVIDQCDTLCTEDALSQGEHFLQTTFRSRLQDLVSSGACSTSKAAQYIAQSDALLTSVVAPAYARLADGLFLLKGRGVNTQGLCYFDQGKSYYQILLASATGSSRSPEEIMTLLTDNFAADYNALCEISVYLQNTLSDSVGALTDIPLLLAPYSPEQMTEDLRVRMTDCFPALSGNITYEIKPVADTLCEYTSPAYYMVPAVDSYENNSIYINYSNQPDALTLYTTLAHEGYPGHLYQNVYHLNDMDASSILPLEGIVSYGGYAEGWATYVEDLSYAYAAAAMAEQCGIATQSPADSDSPLTYETISALCNFYRLDRRIQLCLYSILDLSVHYYGMTQEEARSLLGAYGIYDSSVADSVYEYIVSEPANYPKYYLGYLEIVALKEKAKEIWGDGYSDMRFHTFFLESGPAPFSMLEDALSGS